MAWPPYPPPYTDFNSDLSSSSEEERDAHFAKRNRDPDRVTLVIDYETQPTIGFVVLFDIDWPAGVVGNMGLRIHPSWCDRGIGTTVLNSIVIHLAEVGITRWRLDVKEVNTRAIRCYEKVGFVKTERRERGGIPFLWMELRTKRRPTTGCT